MTKLIFYTICLPTFQGEIIRYIYMLIYYSMDIGEKQEQQQNNKTKQKHMKKGNNTSITLKNIKYFMPGK